MLVLRKSVMLMLAALLLMTSTTAVWAGVVSTQSALQSEQAVMDRDALLEQLSRDEVRQQLETYGVSAEMAQERIAALTDEEVRQMQSEIQEMPAGGDILGTALFVFVILVVLELIGATDIFSWLDSVN